MDTELHNHTEGAVGTITLKRLEESTKYNV